MTNLDSILKSRHYFANKSLSSQGYGFSSGYVWMWELDCEESRALKNWCFWTLVLEKTLESPLDCKGIQPVHSKGDQSWVFFWRTDAEAETPILWPPHVKSWLIGKDPDAGRDMGQEEKGTTGWDGWMASPTWWTWVCVNSGSWWWTGRPNMLQFMRSQRVIHDWVTELNWTIYLLWNYSPDQNSDESCTLITLQRNSSYTIDLEIGDIWSGCLISRQFIRNCTASWNLNSHRMELSPTLEKNWLCLWKKNNDKNKC